MKEINIAWTETRTHSYDVSLPLADVMAIVMEHAPEIIQGAIVEAFDNALHDVDRMGPILEAIRVKLEADIESDELTDLNDTSASVYDVE